MIVPDATIVAGFIFPKDDLHSIARAVRQKDSDWHCPDLVFSEVRSVALKHRSKGAALESLIALCNLCAASVSVYRLDNATVLSAAVEGKLWAYDAEYVALARKLECKLVTTDRDVLKSFPGVAIDPQAFLKS